MGNKYNLGAITDEKYKIGTSSSKILLFCKQGNNNLLLFINGKNGKIEHQHKFQFDYYRGTKLINIVELFKENRNWKDWFYFESSNILYNGKTKEVAFLKSNDIWQTSRALWAIVEEGERKEKVLYKLPTKNNGFLTFKKIPKVAAVVQGENYLGMIEEKNTTQKIIRVFRTTNLGNILFETELLENTKPIIKQDYLAYINREGQLVIQNLKDNKNHVINRDFDFLMKDVFLGDQNVYIRSRKDGQDLLHMIPLYFSQIKK